MTLATSQHKWDQRFLEEATRVADWSKDPSTKVGAVIVRPDNTVVSLGFNGFPQKMEDAEQWLNSPEDRHLRTVHAELNALCFAKGETVGCTLYSSVMPCHRCAPVIIQFGIVKVVTTMTVETRNITEEQYELARGMFRDCNILLIERNG